MATNDSAEMKQMRALIVTLQERGENAEAKRLQAALNAGTTAREGIEHAARALVRTY